MRLALLGGATFGAMLGAGIAVNVQAQRPSAVSDNRVLCQTLTENKNTRSSVGLAGFDFVGVITVLSCSVDEINQRLQALEKKQRELGDPK